MRSAQLHALSQMLQTIFPLRGKGGGGKSFVRQSVRKRQITSSRGCGSEGPQGRCVGWAEVLHGHSGRQR